MDRRTFVQSLSCLGVTTTLPTFAFTGGARPQTSIRPPGQSDKMTIPPNPRIGVIAVGEAGGTIVSELYGELPNLSFSMAIDVDCGSLARVEANRRILIGDAMARPGDARAASKFANEARTRIDDSMADLDIAFIVTGMGGIAATTISPIVAEVLRRNPVLTIAAVLTPVNSESTKRHLIAVDGALSLRDIANVTFDIADNGLCSNHCPKDLPLRSSPEVTTFEMLYRGITEPIASSDYLISHDSESLMECISTNGAAAIGFGSASGRNAVEVSTRRAITHPLLGEDRLRSASGIWVLIEGAPEYLKLRKIVETTDLIREFLGFRSTVTDPILLLGGVRNNAMNDDFRVTILATGIPREN